MRTILALIASAGLVGCVGSIESPSGFDKPADPVKGDGNDNGDNPAKADLSAAKALFDSGVYSVLKAKCSGGACHSDDAQGSTLTRFVAKDAALGWQIAVNYTALVGNFTETAPIITYIAPGHKGVTWTQAEKDSINKWLAKELELRNGQLPPVPGAPTPTQVSEALMAQFAGCMKLGDFQAANMANAWAKLQSDEGQCEQCHSNGGEGFMANNDAATTFGILSSKKMHFLQYFTVDLTKGNAMAKVIPNTVSFAGVCNRQAPHIEHPTFPCTNNAGTAALTNFYNKTMANIMAGGCTPKQLEDI